MKGHEKQAKNKTAKSSGEHLGIISAFFVCGTIISRLHSGS